MKTIEVKNISKIYSDAFQELHVLDNISFDVNSEDFICILGCSGCGKSTLLRCMTGLDHPTSGAIYSDGIQMLEPSISNAIVFQTLDQLLPWKTLGQNVMYPLERKKYGDNNKCKFRAKEYLEMVGLKSFFDYYPHQLSGGMKQRGAIARALATQSKTIFMDEPFGSLDWETRNNIYKELVNIWRNLKITIVFITHNLDEAIFLANRIIVLSNLPAHIKKEIENPVEGDRSPNNKGYAEFRNLLSECMQTNSKNSSISSYENMV